MQTTMNPVAKARGKPAIPPLESGDHLDATEFERRYEAMGEACKKAELIGGVVYVASPVTVLHGEPQGLLITWLGNFAVATAAVHLYSDITLRLDRRNVAQPDAVLSLDPLAGGIVRIDPGDYLRAPVELVAETAHTSASYDLHSKLNAYRRKGVREYLVHVVHSREVRWFFLDEEDEYSQIQPDARGVLRSRVFPGLWLDTRAFVGGDGARVLATLRRGMRSPEYRAFATALKAKLGRRRER